MISGSSPTDFVPAKLACGPVGGLNKRDQRSSAWQQAVKGERMHASARPKIRVKARIGLSSGFVAGEDASRTGSRRKLKRPQPPVFEPSPLSYKELMSA